MQAMNDMALLREYATRNSEDTFAELVSRRLNFVYSAACWRKTNPLQHGLKVCDIKARFHLD
jgi:hypothetical protein